MESLIDKLQKLKSCLPETTEKFMQATEKYIFLATKIYTAAQEFKIVANEQYLKALSDYEYQKGSKIIELKESNPTTTLKTIAESFCIDYKKNLYSAEHLLDRAKSEVCIAEETLNSYKKIYNERVIT